MTKKTKDNIEEKKKTKATQQNKKQKEKGHGKRNSKTDKLQKRRVGC